MTSPAGDKPLPRLRAELELLPGAAAASGAPNWLIHDPLLNRFVQIDVATYETLKVWHDCRSVGELIARVNAAGRAELDGQSIGALICFLQANRLTMEPAEQGWRHFARDHDAQQHSLLGSLVHNYLFFRIPLVRPQAFLERTLFLVRPLVSMPMRLVLVAMGLLGLYLSSREWDAFTAGFDGLATWEGAALMGATLILVKAAHELGHAYATVAYGCRVHTMGVAFVVMAPLLYTDVTDSWRLRDRRKRLMIDSAGILVELGIAAVALFFWAFLPPGAARSIAFTLSVVSVASSLAINLNPFMRFDGYYLLSELLGVDNLQARAFEFGRWKMRELLFELGIPPPEDMPRRLAAFLIGYAWLVWVYRLVLFIGIAMLVYQYFFKILGIILFAIEIVFFIARPVQNEMRVWMRERRKIIATKRSWVTAVIALAVAGACVMPWSTRVEIPAVVESARLQPIHPGRAARVAEVVQRHHAIVKAGDVLVRLESPEIDQEIRQTLTRLALARFQHGRRGADADDRASSIVIESSIDSLQTKLEGLEKERQELVLRAPFDGRVVEIDPELAPGRWVTPKEPIAIVAGDGDLVVRGYVREADLWRVMTGSTGTFVPEMPLRPSISVRVDVVATSGAAEIDIADLASINSGRIEVSGAEGRKLVPTSAQYLVRMSAVSSGEKSELSVRGVVVAEGKAESLLAASWRQVVKVLLREAGA